MYENIPEPWILWAKSFTVIWLYPIPTKMVNKQYIVDDEHSFQPRGGMIKTFEPRTNSLTFHEILLVVKWGSL